MALTTPACSLSVFEQESHILRALIRQIHISSRLDRVAFGFHFPAGLSGLSGFSGGGEGGEGVLHLVRGRIKVPVAQITGHLPFGCSKLLPGK